MSRLSKQKGAAFEREIARALSLWITNGKKEDCFWRSAMSGGRASVKLAAYKGKAVVLGHQCGDLSAISREGFDFLKNLYVEIKHLKEISLWGLFTGKGKLIEYWLHTQAQAALYKKYPILIIRQNNRPTLFCVDNSFGLFAHNYTGVNRYQLNIVLLDDVLATTYHSS